jgi:hypothetical protein
VYVGLLMYIATYLGSSVPGPQSNIGVNESMEGETLDKKSQQSRMLGGAYDPPTILKS